MTDGFFEQKNIMIPKFVPENQKKSPSKKPKNFFAA